MKNSKEGTIITILNVIGVMAIFVMALPFDKIMGDHNADNPNHDVKHESKEDNSGQPEND